MNIHVVKAWMKRWPLVSRLYPFLYELKFRTERRSRIRKLKGKDSFPADVLVIEVGHGGLGDSLLHSHLPRIAKASGKYSQVFLSNVTPFRNPAHRRVVWELNPHVDGFTDAPGILFQDLLKNRPGRFSPPFRVREGHNLLDEIMLAYGLDDGKRFHEPELYYRPRLLPELQGKTLYDPNWVSPVNYGVTPDRLERYFSRHRIRVDLQFEPRQRSRPLPSCPEMIRDRSFEHFCDIVYSCHQLYCFATGTAALAAALGKPAHVFYHRGLQPEFLFSKVHRYINLDDPTS